MTVQDLAALHLAAPAALPLDAMIQREGTQQLAGQLPGHHVPVTRLDEPTSLTLALVGVATLAAYRGIWKRLVGPSAATKTSLAPRASIKPRRRAA